MKNILPFTCIVFILHVSCKKNEILKGKTAILKDFGTQELFCKPNYSYYFEIDGGVNVCINIPDSITAKYINNGMNAFLIDYSIIDNQTCVTDNNKKKDLSKIELITLVKKQ